MWRLEFVLWFLVVCVLPPSKGQEEIKAKPGKDVPLPCHGPRNDQITLLEWMKPELNAEGFVFFYRNNRSYESYQHPSYRGRVELRDKSSVKDGDVSVILKNAAIGDSGTYECRIIISNTINGERSTSELRRLLSLKVTDSGETAENTWDGGNKGEGNKGEGNKGEGNKGEGNKGERRSDEGSLDETTPISPGAIVAIVAGLVGGVIVVLYLMRYRKDRSKFKKCLTVLKPLQPQEV